MTECRVLHICMCLSRGDAQLACAVRVDRLGVDQEAGIRRSTDGTEDGECGMRSGSREHRVPGVQKREARGGGSFSPSSLVFFWSLVLGPWLYSREFSMAGMGWMIDVAFGFMLCCSGFRSQLARRRRRRAGVGWFLRKNGRVVEEERDDDKLVPGQGSGLTSCQSGTASWSQSPLPTLSQAKPCLGAIIAVGARQNPPFSQSPTKMSTTCDHNAMSPSVES